MSKYFILMTVQAGKYADVDEFVRDFDEVVEVYSVQGEYDLIIELNLTRSTPAYIITELGNIEGVIHTQTIEVIESIKGRNKDTLTLWPLRRDTAIIKRKPAVYFSKTLFMTILIPSAVIFYVYFYHNLLPFEIPHVGLLGFFPALWIALLCLLILSRRFFQMPNVILIPEGTEKKLKYTILRVRPDYYNNILEILKKLPNIVEAYVVSGIGDILVKWKYDNGIKLTEIISRQRGYIVSLEELVNLKVICTVKASIQNGEGSCIETEDGLWIPSSKEIGACGQLFACYRSVSGLFIIAIIIGVLIILGAQMLVAFIFAVLGMIYVHTTRPFRIRAGVSWTIIGIVLSLTLSFVLTPQSKTKEEKSLPVIAVVTGSVVNVRSGPGIKCNIMTKLKRNDTVEVLEKNGEWHKVRSVEEGWIHSSLVSISATSQ